MTTQRGRSGPPRGRWRAQKRWFVTAVGVAVVMVVMLAVVLLLGDDSGSSGAIGAVGVVSIATVLIIWFESRRVERRLRERLDNVAEAEAEVRRLLDELPEAVVLVDGAGVVHSANAAAIDVCGRTREELVGAVFVDLAPERLAEPWQRVLAGGRAEPALVELADPHAPPPDTTVAGVEATPAVRTVEVSFHAARGDSAVARDQTAQRIVVRLRDVSEREQHTRALEQARRRFQQAFHSAPTGMALVRLDDGRIVDANQSLSEMLDRPVEALVGRSLRELTHPDDMRAAVPHRARLELGIIDSYRLDQRYRRSDGEFVWARTRVSVTEDDGVMLAITHIEDVTEQRRTAEQLTYAARHDDLTGLPNRSFLLQMLSGRLDGAALASVAVLFIDIDHFKVVNDSLGHGAGDELLRAMAERLARVVREGDVLARFGGDEFIVVLDGSRHGVDPSEVAERVRRAVHEPIVIDDQELFVTASIGYTSNLDASATPNDLLRDADAAMYRAKARGRDCVEAFEAGDHESTVLALRTAGELRRGIERDEIVPYFQPIVDLPTGTIVGFEVLARWLHPDRGLLTPNQFLPLAEETGLLTDVGEAMLRNSMWQLTQWRSTGKEFSNVTLSVNVGTRQLVDPAFYHLVGRLLTETGLDPDLLWLEITETALLADVKAATIALRDLRNLGLHLSVDDFGTGYSSLTYLKRFPVEAIKVDRAFVSGLGIEAEDSTIVEAVVKLGQALGLTVVAEGVETPLQLARLRELGCDKGQGYLFGRPRPASLIERERMQA